MNDAKKDLRSFVPSLEAVASAFGVSIVTVGQWRESGCPALDQRPYDLQAINSWLQADAERKIDDTLELRKAKLEAEVEQLKQTNSVFSKDKAFWIAAAALGITISSEVRQWLAAPDDQNVKLAPKKRRRLFEITLIQHDESQLTAGEFRLLASKEMQSIFMHCIRCQNQSKGSERFIVNLSNLETKWPPSISMGQLHSSWRIASQSAFKKGDTLGQVTICEIEGTEHHQPGLFPE